MVRFSRAWWAVVRMGHPQVIRFRQLMRDDGGNTLKSQDNREGLRTLPLNPLECAKFRTRVVNWDPLGYRHASLLLKDQDGIFPQSSQCLFFRLIKSESCLNNCQTVSGVRIWRRSVGVSQGKNHGEGTAFRARRKLLPARPGSRQRWTCSPPSWSSLWANWPLPSL